MGSSPDISVFGTDCSRDKVRTMTVRLSTDVGSLVPPDRLVTLEDGSTLFPARLWPPQ